MRLPNYSAGRRSPCATWPSAVPRCRQALAFAREPVPTPKNLYSASFSLRVSRQYCHVIPPHSVRLTPCSSRYQLLQPPVFHTEPASLVCSSSLDRFCAERLGANACAPDLSTAAIASAT